MPKAEQLTLRRVKGLLKLSNAVIYARAVQLQLLRIQYATAQIKYTSS